MKREIRDIDLDLLDDDNVRKGVLDPQLIKELADNMALYDQQDPIIVYPKGGKRFGIADGHRRVAAKRLHGAKTIEGIVLAEAPTPPQLRLLQLSLALQRSDFNIADQAEALAFIMQEEGWTASGLAEQLCKSPPTITRVLTINKLSPEHRQLVREGRISSSAAYALARMEPEARQLYVEKLLAGEVTRDDLNKAAQKKSADRKRKPPKVERLAFDLPSCSLSFAAKKPISYEVMQETVRELSKLINMARHKKISIEIFAKWLRSLLKNGDVTPGEVSP